MRWLRFAVLILAATILQTSLTGIIAVTKANIKPDLLLILLVFFAVRCDLTDAVITSFTIGFAADLAGPTLGLMGPRTISFGLIGTLISDLHSVISTRRVVYQAITIFLVGVLTAGLSHVLALLRAETIGVSLSVELLWQPLYSAVLGPFLFLPVGWWMGMNKKSRRYGGRRSPFR
jgi:rod shape-determining protein MreD